MPTPLVPSPAGVLACGFLAFLRPPKKAVRRLVDGLWSRVSEKLADQIADKVANLIWFIVSLGIWYLATRLGIKWPTLG